jgi:hypothetical protein
VLVDAPEAEFAYRDFKPPQGLRISVANLKVPDIGTISGGTVQESGTLEVTGTDLKRVVTVTAEAHGFHSQSVKIELGSNVGRRSIFIVLAPKEP